MPTMIKAYEIIRINNDILMIIVFFSMADLARLCSRCFGDIPVSIWLFFMVSLLHDKLIYANCLIVYLVQRETASLVW